MGLVKCAQVSVTETLRSCCPAEQNKVSLQRALDVDKSLAFHLNPNYRRHMPAGGRQIFASFSKLNFQAIINSCRGVCSKFKGIAFKFNFFIEHLEHERYINKHGIKKENEYYLFDQACNINFFYFVFISNSQPQQQVMIYILSKQIFLNSDAFENRVDLDMRRVSKEINNQDTRFKHEKKEVLKTCKNASCVKMTGAGHGYNRGIGGGNLVLPTWLRMKCASSSRIPCPRSHLKKRNKKKTLL